MFQKIIYQIALIFGFFGIGLLARYFGHIKDEGLKDLSNLSINILMPALIFYSIITQLNKADLTYSWYLPILGMISIAFPILLSLFLSLFMDATNEEKRTFIYTCSFNNYNFIPIPLVFMFFKEKGLALLFLHNVGCTILYWTIGIWLLSGKKDKDTFKRILSPSFVIVLLSVLISYFEFNKYIPNIVLDLSHTLGLAAIPLSLIVVGGIIGRLNLKKIIYDKTLFILIPFRLILMPLLISFIIQFLGLSGMIKTIILFVAVMPSAVSTPMMVNLFGGNAKIAASSSSMTTAISIITIPIMLSFLLQ